MGNKDDENIERIDNTEGFLALPFDKDQFKDFLVGLLGKPQRIRRTIKGSFEVQLSDIQNFHYLIQQRIEQQNDGKLLQFRAKIGFNDDSSVELNSFEELETYNEVRPIVSTSVELSWDYLVLFRDKKVPEKQTIDIGIETRRTYTVFGRDYDDDGDGVVIGNAGEFNITIHHTARTWAADMESMLANHVNSLLHKPDKLRMLLRKYQGFVATAAGVMFFLTTVVGSFWITKVFIDQQLSTIGNEIAKEANVTNKLDILSSFIINGTISEHYFKVLVFLVISVFLSILFAAWVTSNIVSPSYSFIILTRKSLEHRNSAIKANERLFRNFIFANVASIVTSLVSD